MKKTKVDHYTDKEALEFHSHKKPGKIEIIASKSMITKRDLALAYSPGVAVPVKKISENPEAAYDYTSKGNLVAVISNTCEYSIASASSSPSCDMPTHVSSPDALNDTAP